MIWVCLGCLWCALASFGVALGPFAGSNNSIMHYKIAASLIAQCDPELILSSFVCMASNQNHMCSAQINNSIMHYKVAQSQ